MRVLQLRKNFSFFCSCMKMTPGVTEHQTKKERVGVHESKIFDAGSQNQKLQYKPQYLKSLKSEVFKNFIFKIGIRHNLLLLVFIFFVGGEGEELRRGVMGENMQIFSSDWRQFFRRY